MPPNSPELHRATRSGDYGAVLRLARVAAGLHQDDLGRRIGCAQTTISRYETGQTPIPRDTAVLLANTLGVNLKVFGFTSPQDPPTPPRVVGTDQEEDDVRRRTFLAAAGLAPLITAPGAAAESTTELERGLRTALFTPHRPAPATTDVVRAELQRAWAAFNACDYDRLAVALPGLLPAADNLVPDAARIASSAYLAATRAAMKLDHRTGLDLLAADRAVRAAQTAADPLHYAESIRLRAGALRRAGHHRDALDHTLAALEPLEPHEPDHIAAAIGLHLSAGYAAALAGDRERSTELLNDAERLTGHIPHHPNAATMTANLISHRVSAAHALGDAGTALHHAHSIPIASIPTTERRARILVDTALAWADWDKPDKAARTLLAAEATAPAEVRTRGTARRLVHRLLNTASHTGKHELRGLAARLSPNHHA